MRGKGIKPCNQRVRMGITPAYAGKSFPFFGIIRLHWDHPRICGEKRHSVNTCPVKLGSPPHMRGKAASPFAFTIFIRITPAYAGKSKCQVWHGQSRGDHPRICGEKSRAAPCTFFVVGSPPHMRGKVHPHGVGLLHGGITPAYAGKSTLHETTNGTSQDHPRICGEKPPSLL